MLGAIAYAEINVVKGPVVSITGAAWVRLTRTRAKRNGAFAEFGYKGIASSLAASGCDSVCALTLACKLVVRVKLRI